MTAETSPADPAETAPAPETADEDSRAAAFLEQQISETAPDLPADLRRAIAHLGASIAKKTVTETRPETPPEPAAAPAPQLPAAAPSARILQFPLPFGDDTRAVSNPLARCALLGFE